jgi:integrase
MTVRVVWYTQKRKWYLDGPTPGKKRYRRALGPKPEDKARGEVLATKMNAQQTAMVERRAALVRGQPILGEVALRACWELSRSAYSATANPERLLKRFLVPYFGGLDLRMLTELEIQDFAGKMAQVRKQRSGSGTLGICTIENALSILRRTLYWLESRRDLDFRVPVRRILALGRAAAAAKGARRGIRQAWSPEDAQLLLSQLASHPELHAVCFAALHTGMRKGELLALEWDDIDFRRGTISVSKSLTQADRVKAPKSENSYRTVQMSAALHAGLDAAVALHHVERDLSARAQPSAPPARCPAPALPQLPTHVRVVGAQQPRGSRVGCRADRRPRGDHVQALHASDARQGEAGLPQRDRNSRTIASSRAESAGSAGSRLKLPGIVDAAVAPTGSTIPTLSRSARGTCQTRPSRTPRSSPRAIIPRSTFSLALVQ